MALGALLPKYIDGARPDQVTVFLGDAHVESVVAIGLQWNTAGEMQSCVGVLVGHSEHAVG